MRFWGFRFPRSQRAAVLPFWGFAARGRGRSDFCHASPFPGIRLRRGSHLRVGIHENGMVRQPFLHVSQFRYPQLLRRQVPLPSSVAFSWRRGYRWAPQRSDSGSPPLHVSAGEGHPDDLAPFGRQLPHHLRFQAPNLHRGFRASDRLTWHLPPPLCPEATSPFLRLSTSDERGTQPTMRTVVRRTFSSSSLCPLE